MDTYVIYEDSYIVVEDYEKGEIVDLTNVYNIHHTDHLNYIYD